MSRKASSNQNKILRLLTIFAIVVASLFGLSACNPFDSDTDPSSSLYDAEGRLKTTAVNVSKIKPGTNGSVDYNTGSFVWNLEYYLDSIKKGERLPQGYDQIIYGSEFFYDDASPFEASVNDIKFLIAEESYPDAPTVGATGFYYIYNDVATRVYTRFELPVRTLPEEQNLSGLNLDLPSWYGETLEDFNSNGNIAYKLCYPSYTVSISGIIYQLKIDVDYSKIVFDFNENQMFKLDGSEEDFADAAAYEDYINQVFTISYRTGSNGDWLTCSENYNMASVFIEDGLFKIRFNPMLGKGSNSRYIRVQTNASYNTTLFPSGSNRGNSAYTSPTTFSVYKLTFKVSCNNSIESTYESLTYDANKYYFSNKDKSVVESQLGLTDTYTSLTGYFVENKIVDVSRYIDKTNDYAFQSWTINGKADNTVVLGDTLPNNTIYDVDNVNDGANNLSCLSAYSVATVGVKEIVYNSALNNNADVSSETINTDNEGYIEGIVSVVCCNKTANNTVYANIAKVKDFVLTGTVYNGDDFFTANSEALLPGTDIYIWQKSNSDAEDTLLATYCSTNNGATYSFKAITLGDYVSSIGISEATFGSGCSYANGQFSIGYLAYNCYLTFAKKDTKQNGDETTYEFYSTAMAEYDKTKTYILSPFKNVRIYSDRAGNVIIGTALDPDSTVQVNLYVTNDGDANLILLGSAQAAQLGITHQVISTTNSVVDAFGYTKSSVIISLMLPSNTTLVSYNAESINSVVKAIYTKTGQNANNATQYVLCDVGYNEVDRTNTYTYYYVETANINDATISDGPTLNCLLYDGEYFEYSHRDKEGNEYIYYYERNETITKNEGAANEYSYIIRHVIARYKDGENVSYKYYTYRTLVNNDVVQEYEVVRSNTANNSNQIEISYKVRYGGETYSFETQSSGADVTLVAQSYKTDMVFDKDRNLATTDDQQPIYVYYNIDEYTYINGENSVTEYYYTAPIGQKITSISGASLELTTTVTWYNQEMTEHSNINALTANKTVMLGSEILQYASDPSSEYYSLCYNFYKLCKFGATLIATSYYYVKPLETPVELLVSQSYSTDAEEIEVHGIAYYQYVQDPAGDYVFDETIQNFVRFDGANPDHVGKTLYSKVLYSDNVHSRVAGYVFGFGGLFNTYGSNPELSEPYPEMYFTVTYDNNGKNPVYHYTNPTTGTQYQFTREDDALYKQSIGDNGLEIVPFELTGFNKSSFKNMEKTQSLYKNAEILIFEGTSYVNTLVYETYNTVNLTPIYTVYTYSASSTKIYESIIYFDGTNLYLDMGTNISMSESDEDNNTTNVTTHRVVTKLEQDGNNYYYITQDGVKVVVYNGNSIVRSFIDNGNVYYNYCNYSYYHYDDSNMGLAKYDKTALGEQYYIGFTSATLTNTYIPINSQLVPTDVLYAYYANEGYNSDTGEYDESYRVYDEPVVYIQQGTQNNIVRRAVLASNTNIDVHLLGKVVLLGDGEFDVYPSFNYYLENSTTQILRYSEEELNYYNVDYTTVDAVIQAFPGIKILNGAPYVNPIFYFEVRHKANEQAIVEIGIKVAEVYYVEVMSTALKSEDNNLIYDFSTVSFKDTITNLTSNDYIDRMYFALDKATQNTVVAYTFNGTEYEAYLSGNPLTIQNMGLLDKNNQVYSILKVNEKNEYYDPLYYKKPSGEYELLTTDRLMIWESSPTILSDIPAFDSYAYYVSDDGKIKILSDIEGNIDYQLIESLFLSGTGSNSSEYEYSDVLIGGYTNAYRVNKNTLSYSEDLQSFWWEDAIEISNTYNSTQPYFLTDREGCVLVASPIVQIAENDSEKSIIYKFKHWAVYSRYNSEVLYYNADISKTHGDINNAVMRFSWDQAGYFIFMPIYERVYEISIGTTIDNGAPNLGGGISVTYTGESVDMSKSKYGENALNIFFVEILPTAEDEGKPIYYYSNLDITPILYYSGTKVDGYPVFEVRYDVFKIYHGSSYSYYALNESTGRFERLNILSSFSNSPGVVEVDSQNGKYSFLYVDVNKHATYVSYYAGDLLRGDPEERAIDDLFSHTYYVDYHMDGVSAGGKAQSKIAFFYKKATQKVDEDKQPMFDDNGNPIYDNNGFENGDDHMYAIPATDFVNAVQSSFESVADFMESMVAKSEKFARKIVNHFNSLATVNDAYVSLDYSKLPDDFADSSESFYYSSLAYLASGELYSYVAKEDKYSEDGETLIEETGKEYIYTTQQFKDSYFERGSKLIISAISDYGYRLKDWYLAEYDYRTQSWVIGDTPLRESNEAIYRSIIRKIEYNSTTEKWYYITEFFNEFNGGNKIYYYTAEDRDNALENPGTQVDTTEVPENMVNSLCGYYLVGTDNFNNPTYTPVYRQNDKSNDWYLDELLTVPYTGAASPEYRAHASSINVWQDGNTTRYLLGDVEVYKNENNGQFYRIMDIGDMLFYNSKIYIYNLTRNIKVVASFIEVYQSFIFAEDSNDKSVTAVSLYYTGTRTDANNNILGTVEYIDQMQPGDTWGYYDPLTTGISRDDLSYTTFGNTEEEKLAAKNRQYSSINRLTYHGYTSLERLENPDEYNIHLLKANEEEINFKRMHFDVETTIYVVARVYYETELTIHSLGMNGKYQLTPLVFPTDEFMNENRAADNPVEYFYYVFMVTFNRDLEFYNNVEENEVTGELTTTSAEVGNYNPEYLAHVKRKKALVADVIAGNYTPYYSQYFEFFDSDGKQITYNTNANKTEITLDENYKNIIKAKLEGYGIDTSENNEELKDILDNPHSSLFELFKKIRYSCGVILSIKFVKDISTTEENTKQLTGVDEIYNIIAKKFVASADDELYNGKGGGFARKIAPIKSGTTNFINLSTIPIYTYTTSIQVLNDVSIKNGNNYTVEYSQSVKDKLLAAGVALEQSLYTRGGYQGYTYIGPGIQHTESTSITINGVSNLYANKFTGNTKVEPGEDNYLDMFEEEYALAKDSIMVLGGLYNDDENPALIQSDGGVWYTEVDGIKYIFSGWYEQKLVEENNREYWGELQLMSTDITTPFASVAYADTNIIALFERAVNLTFVDEISSATINFNTMQDSLGNEVSIKNDALDTPPSLTISGVFTVSSLLSLEITPSGGYRIGDSWTILATGTEVDEDTKNTVEIAKEFSFSHKDTSIAVYKQVDDKQTADTEDDETITDFSQMNLATSLTISFNLGYLLNQAEAEVPGKCDTLTIGLGMTPVQLTYVNVDGYTSTDAAGTETLSGYEFNMYHFNGSSYQQVVATQFVDGQLTNAAEATLIDSAQRPLHVELHNGSLTIYGYFDFDQFNGSLYVEAVPQAGTTALLKAWYINTAGTTTNDLDPAIENVTFAYRGDTVEAFQVCYEYTDNKYKQYNNYFDLNEENYVYLLSAKIQADSVLNVSYATIDNLQAVNKNITLNDANLITKADKGTISWTGTYINDDNNKFANGYLPFEDADGNPCTSRYRFYSDTKVTLNNDMMIYEADGEKYAFLGWFRYFSNHIALETTAPTYQIPSAGGHHVAIFVKLAHITSAHTITITVEDEVETKIDGSINSNGSIFLNSNYNIGASSVNVIVPDQEELYLMVGGKIDINVEADTTYLVNDIVYFFDDGNETQVNNILGLGTDNARGSINTIQDEDVTIEAQLCKGHDIRIIQLYFDSIEMNNVGIPYTDNNLVSVKYFVDNAEYNLSGTSAICVSTSTVLKLKFTEKAYLGLIGYYVNGEKLEFDDIQNYLTNYVVDDDAIIEVRITRYVDVRSQALSLADPAHSIDSEVLKGINTQITYKNIHNENIITYTYLATAENRYTLTRLETTSDGTEVSSNVAENLPISSVWNKVLSGSILTLNTFTDLDYGFIRWDESKNQNSAQEISTLAEFNHFTTYAKDPLDASEYMIIYSAIYQSSSTVDIYKLLSSFNNMDEALIKTDINSGNYITFEKNNTTYYECLPELWSLLDVTVKYVDLQGIDRTIILGGNSSLEDLKVQTGSTLEISLNISNAVDKRYHAYIVFNGNNVEDHAEVTIPNDKSVFDVCFYAIRSITIIRHVNNQETAVYENNILQTLFTNDFVNYPIEVGYSSRTEYNLAISNNLAVSAQGQNGYVFAGFFINGVSVGKGAMQMTGFHLLNIMQGENGLIANGETYYTLDTDLVIVALWYASTDIVTKVMVDGNDIVADGATNKQKDLSEKVNFRLIGNKITPVDNLSIYNTNIQDTLVAVDNTSFKYLTHYNEYRNIYNLTLLASSYVGYQFVGFFYTIDNGNSWTKLDFCNSDTSYNHGDTLSSMLAISSGGYSIVIEARYVTAYQITLQTAVVNSENESDKLNSVATSYMQLLRDGSGWKNVSTELSTFAGTGDNNCHIDYFYPQYSNFIAVAYDASILDTSLSHTGYYINGIFTPIVNTFEDGSFTYAVFNIRDLISYNATTKLYDTKNFVIESKYVQNVDYIVRIGIDNTNDINKIKQEALENIVITVTYSNMYTAEPITTHYYYSSSLGETYWNEANDSLFIKLHLPIGTKISATIEHTDSENISVIGAIKNVTDKVVEYIYNGWFVYADYSIGGSTSVINYTNNTEFTLTEDVGVVAQFYTHDITKTTDTQFTYTFKGQDFGGQTIFTPAIQANPSNNSIIATYLTKELSKLAYNYDYATPINITASKELANDDNLTASLNIYSEDGIMFTVTYVPDTQGAGVAPTYTKRFMFMGWYQEIKNNKTPSKYLYVTNNIGLNYSTGSMPAQMLNATNMTAMFTQIVEIELGFDNAKDYNLINYSNIVLNYLQASPLYFANRATAEKITDYLFTKLDATGKLTINTLYGTELLFNYHSVYGYHILNPILDSANLDQKTQPYNGYINGVNKNINVDYLANGERNNGLEIIPTLVELTKQSFASFEKNFVLYTFTTSENEIQTVFASADCKNPDHEHLIPEPPVAATSVTAGGSKSSSSLKASVFTRSAATLTNAAAAVGDDLNIQENEDDVKTYVSGQIISGSLAVPNEYTGVTLVVTIRFPNGSIKALTLDSSKRFDIFEDGTLQSLPLGTQVSIQTLNLENRTEVLNNIKVFSLSSDEFNDPTFNPLSSEEKFSALAETLDFVVTEDLHNLYLRIVVSYFNIYNIELEENNIDQGSVAISFHDAPDGLTQYNVSADTYHNYSFNSLTISFDKPKNADEYEVISVRLIDLLAAGIEATYTNLTDIVNHYLINDITEITLTGSYEGWKITKNDNVISVEYNPLVKIDFTFNFNEEDSSAYKYITGFESIFSINTSVKLSTEYLHVTHVSTNYLLERFDANTTDYIKYDDNDTDYVIYIFDYQFYSYNESDTYYAIVRLNEFYQTVIEDLAEELAFIGYYYTGTVLSNTTNDEEQFLVLTRDQADAGTECSDIIRITAVYAEALETYIGVDVDYYNNELNPDIIDNDNLLGTETDTINLYQNDEQILNYADTAPQAVYSYLINTADLQMIDSFDHFSFVEWYVTYNDKLLAKSSDERYTISYANLCLDANFYIELVEQYKASIYYSLNTDIYAQYNNEEIDISAFKIYAVMKEEVVELDISYDFAGEEFDITVKKDTAAVDTIASTNQYYDESTKYKEITVTLDDGKDYNVLVYQEEVESGVPAEPNNFRLKVAYSKSLCDSNVSIDIVAKSYQTRNNEITARTLKPIGMDYNPTAVRVISTEDNTYSTNKYIKIDGFVGALSDINLLEDNNAKNSLKLDTNVCSHSTTFKLKTSNMYLIELGMALYTTDGSLDAANSNKLTVSVNGYEPHSIDGLYSLEENTNYAAVSILAAEGDIVSLDVDNRDGILSYKSPATPTSFKCLALSQTYTISDIYKHFLSDHSYEDDNGDTLTIEKVADKLIYSATRDHWLGTDGSALGKENEDYMTLNQYSNYTLPLSQTSYTFIATSNLSAVADYIGLFEEQKRYISAILNADYSISVENKTQGEQPTYTGENFAFTIAGVNTPFEFKQIAEELPYTFQELGGNYVVCIHCKKDTDGLDISSDEDGLMIIEFKQPSSQLAIGLVTDKYVSASIEIAYKYLTKDPTLLAALSRAAAALSRGETYESTLIKYGYELKEEHSSYVYVVDLTTEDGNVKDLYHLIENNELSNHSTTLTAEKNIDIALVAEELDGYTFAGFKLVSTFSNISTNHEAQNVTGSTYYTNINKSLKHVGARVSNYQTYDINGKQYHYAIFNNLDSNIKVVAIYEPIIYILSATKMEFNENDTNNIVDDVWRPDLASDETTGLGKIYADSFIIKSNQIIELKVVTNGYAEYKGSILDNDVKIKALYSTLNQINYYDSENNKPIDITYNNLNNEEYKNTNGMANAVTKFEDDDLTEYSAAADRITYKYYEDNNTGVDISRGVTRGYLTENKLFTDDYSTLIDNQFNQNVASVSYLYLMLDEVSSDINLYSYFSTIYYTINVELAEIEYGYTDKKIYENTEDTEERTLGNSPYLAYTQEIMSDENWVNPSADSQNLAQYWANGWITQEDYDNGIGFGIADKDPYVYTFVDCNGIQLSYPVRVTREMVTTIEASNGNNVLWLKAKGTATVAVQPTPTEGTNILLQEEGSGIKRITDQYKNTQIESFLDYIEYDSTNDNYSFKDNLFVIKIGDETISSGELNTSTATVIIGEKYESITVLNIMISELASLTIKLNFKDTTKAIVGFSIKVFADHNTGFQNVGLFRPTTATEAEDKINDGAVMFSSAEVWHDSETPNPAYSNVGEDTAATGFENAYFADDFDVDEETGYMICTETSLKLNALLSYGRTSKYTTANVQFNNVQESWFNRTSLDIEITNPNKTIEITKNDNRETHTQTSLLESLANLYHSETDKSHCEKCEQFTYCGGDKKCEDKMIGGYYLYIVSNIQMYFDALGEIGNNNPGFKATVVDLMSEFVAFNPTKYTDVGDITSYYYPVSGDIFDYLSFSRSDFATFLFNFGYQNLYHRLINQDNSDFKFTRLDVLANFNDNVHKNFFGNSLTYGDLVVTVCQLTEHTAPHTAELNIFNDVTEESPAYRYINHALSDWRIVKTTDAYSSHYNNNFIQEMGSVAELSVSRSQAIVNWFSGITNGKDKYAGTYMYVVHSGLMPNSHEFTGEAVTAFNNNLVVDLSVDAQVKTERLAKHHSNLVLVVAEITAGVVIIAAGIALAVYTGGTSAALATKIGIGLLITAGVAVTGVGIGDAVRLSKGYEAADMSPLHNYINNLDFSFD